MVNYTYPGGRFTFSYPAGWKFRVSEEGSSSGGVTAYNYDYTVADRSSHLEGGEAQIGVSFGRTRSGKGMKNAKAISVNGRNFDYVLYRKGDPEAEDLTFWASAQTAEGGWTYTVSLYSTLDPPSEHERLFWDVVESFRIGS